ncbi:MAG: pantoate--beta-alanine ligase [Actinomycetota bacterium]
MTERIVQSIRTVPDLRTKVAEARSAGASVGFVPTMGALHLGHSALIERAAREHDLVVVSIFVNPSQFNQPSDLEDYPRDEANDVEFAAGAGADICFLPSVETIYPDGFATTVGLRGALTETLEGAGRGVGHFDGVATVVTVLLNIVAPDVAYFGAKDAQQALVVQRTVDDLQIPVVIETVETIRDPSGLALSSRNARLTADGRERASTISDALRAVADAISDGSAKSGDAANAIGLERLRAAGVQVEYFLIVDASTLEPADELTGTLLIACAVAVDGVRLIDNLTVSANREAATASR